MLASEASNEINDIIRHHSVSPPPNIKMVRRDRHIMTLSHFLPKTAVPKNGATYTEFFREMEWNVVNLYQAWGLH